MPRRELRNPSQVEQWLANWGEKIMAPGKLIPIGSGALLWHAAQRGIDTPLPENSMDVDPITSDDEVAELCYEAHIGSPFERENGWHINLMPDQALEGLPADWMTRAFLRSQVVTWERAWMRSFASLATGAFSCEERAFL